MESELKKIIEDKTRAEEDFLFRLTKYANPKEALRRFAPHYHFFSLHQIHAFSRILTLFPATDRAALCQVAKVLYEELGEGKDGEVHSVIFEKFASSVGVNISLLPLDKSKVIKGVSDYVDELYEVFTNQSLQVALAAYTFLEESAVRTYGPFLDFLRSLNLSEESIRFFSIHSVIEIEHAEAAKELVKGYVPTIGKEREEYDAQLEKMGNLWENFWLDLKKVARLN